MEIYRGLAYPQLRAAHDRVYFGAWRGTSPTAADLEEARARLGAFLDALEEALRQGQAAPAGVQDYLAKAREAYRQVSPNTSSGPALLLAINNALSYGHRVLDRLLRAGGHANHVSREFARFYDGRGPGEE